MEKIIILGSGPAGLTAAIYAARANLAPLVIEGAEPGGQLMGTTEVENWPGFVEPILGPELIAGIRKQAERFGVRLEAGSVTSVNLEERPFTLGAEGQEWRCQSLIISTGASAKWLGLPNEQRLRGHGVSACATCDGFFFKGKDIAVVGGGDAAMEEATYLTKYALSVTVLVRGSELRASQAMQERALKNPKITFLMNTEVGDVLGEATVVGLRLKNNQTGKESELAVQGLFIAVGHTPNTKLFEGQLELDRGYITVNPRTTETSVAGVFACGDVADF